eukprot:COSAG01_NODE_48137_length_383_cov_11.626761_1_plen_70_part_01
MQPAACSQLLVSYACKQAARQHAAMHAEARSAMSREQTQILYYSVPAGGSRGLGMHGSAGGGRPGGVRQG